MARVAGTSRLSTRYRVTWTLPGSPRWTSWCGASPSLATTRRFFAGGKFQNAAGSDGVFSARQYIARFDATSGSLHPWAVPAGSFQNNSEVASDLAVTCDRITSGFLGPNFLRS